MANIELQVSNPGIHKDEVLAMQAKKGAGKPQSTSMDEHLRKILEEHDDLDLDILNGRNDESYYNFDFLVKSNKIKNRMDVGTLKRFTKE